MEKRKRILVGIALIFLTLSVLVVSFSFTKKPEIVPTESILDTVFQSITEEEIAGHVKLLSSAAFEGRGIGTKGFDMAGEFLAGELRNYGFKPLMGLKSDSYFQVFFLNIKWINWMGKLYQVGELSGTGTISSRNVLGILEGSDLSDEVIVICAHYDHLGVQNGTIYPGADDNTSGVGAVLEIAESLSELQKLGYRARRSILVAFWGAEELGLLGSEYFVWHQPAVPFSSIVAVINLDMIGRGKHDELYVIGSKTPREFPQRSPDMYDAITKVNNYLDFNFIFDDKGERYFERTDSYNFYSRSYSRWLGEIIPVLFLTDGEDTDYHTPRDTFEKIDNGKVEHVAELSLLVVWEITIHQDKPVYYTS